MEYNDEIRHVLQHEEIVQLSELADVQVAHIPLKGQSQVVKQLRPDASSPFIFEKDIETAYPTTEKVRKNDIIFWRDHFFLVNKEIDFDLYVPAGVSVIRVHEGVLPEYLYIYLTSRIASRIRNVLTISSGDNMRTSSRTLAEFPIVKQKDDDTFYLEQFKKISSPDERCFDKLPEILENKTVEDILKKECIDAIILNNKQLLEKHIRADIEEVNACFKSKAYKATIILAGAILEAFLLDWMSELDKVDYFESEFIAKDKEGKDKEKSGLNDYIYYVFKDFYNDYSLRRKAINIKDKRNLVHMKLCLCTNENIDEAVCKDIVNDLVAIMESRSKYS